jgi:hypothetical protein
MTEQRSAEEIKITPEMISAAAEVLWNNPALDIPQGWAELLATEMLQLAFTAAAKEAQNA